MHEMTAPMHRPIQVTLASDAGFAMPLAVTLASLALAHAAGDVEVTVLHDGIPPALRDRIQRGPAEALSVRWLQVDAADVAGAHYLECLTPATLYRLLLPEVLPDTDRILHLDCDVVVADSLGDLWDMPLDGYAAAAVQDTGAPFAAGPLGTGWRALELRPDTPMMNAGVLLVALDAWRATEVGQRVLEVLRAAGSQARWGDQDGLNVVLRNRWKRVHPRWNLQSPDVDGRGLGWALWREQVEEALADPAVIHYNERDKPWNPASRHPLRDRWFDVLDETAFAGWRPGGDLRRRAVARTRRAWHVLIAAPEGTVRLRA